MSADGQIAVPLGEDGAHPLVFLINVDWYFLLHWKDRALAALGDGWDVWVVTRITKEDLRSEIKAYGFNVLNVPISRHSINPLVELRGFLTTSRALRSIGPAVLHSVTIKPICYSLLFSRMFQIPIVMSFPGLGALRTGSLVSRIVWCFLNRLLRLGNGGARSLATFENHDDRAFAEGMGLKFSSSKVLPGAGVDLEGYPLLSQPKNTCVVRILFAARLLRSKGIFELVEVVGRLATEGHAVELLVAGIADISHRDGLRDKELSTLKDKGHVVWLGQVDDMVSVYENCDIVCLPTSYGEGIPRVLIEGAACGRPLVATNVPGCNEIIQNNHNGFTVPVGDLSSLTEALRRLVLDKELRHQFGLAGRRYFESGFSSEKVISQTLKLYRRFFAKGAAG